MKKGRNKNIVTKKVNLALTVLIICFYCLIVSNRVREFRVKSDGYVYDINITIGRIKSANNGIEQIKNQRRTANVVLNKLTFDADGNPIEDYVKMVHDDKQVEYYYNSVEHRFEPFVSSEFYIYVDKESNDEYYDDLIKKRRESIDDYKDSIKDCIRQLRKINLMPGWIAYELNPNSYSIIEFWSN